MSELIQCPNYFTKRDILRSAATIADGNMSFKVRGLSSFELCAAYQAVYDAFVTKPSDEVALIWNDLFVCPMVETGEWNLLDYLNVYAAHINSGNEAYLNWKNPGVKDATPNNNPAFTANQGVAGNGSNAFLNSNFNLSADGVNYLLNSASLGLYIRNNVSENKIPCGVVQNANYAHITPRYGDGNCYVRVNTLVGGSGSAVSGDSRGMWIANRTAANVNDLYRNKIQVINDTDASSARPNANIYVLAWNSGGAALFSTYQASMFFVGSGLSQTNIDHITDYFEAAMDALGTGVIP